jgi:hypothetical protein
MKRCQICGTKCLPKPDFNAPLEFLRGEPTKDKPEGYIKCVFYPLTIPPDDLCYFHQKELLGHFQFTKSPDKICCEEDYLWRPYLKREKKSLTSSKESKGSMMRS